MIDFKDFIRLSEFLDNTIFKVTSDSSPARSTTTVGVIVEPSILERGKGSEVITGVKFTHFAPKRIIAKPTVLHNEAKYYSQLSGDRMPFFTGRINGNNVTYYDDFQLLNENKYATNRSFNADDTYAFNHSKYKALLNNISNEKISSIYTKVEYLKPSTSNNVFVRGINSFITTPFKFQDSYFNATSYTRPRYEGTKNVDAGYLLPYSVTGSVTTTTNKVGVFNNFRKDPFLPNKTVLELKYLSDKDGNLTVLNSSNKNLGDLQNIFRPNDRLTIGFFRNSQNKNDKRYIYETGYSYRPVFYFAKSDTSSALNDSELNFEYLNGYNPSDTTNDNGNVIIKISPGKTSKGSQYPDYQTDFTLGTEVPIYGVFDYHNQIGESNANGKYTNSSYSSITNNKFIASSTTSHLISSKFNIEPVFSSGGSVSYSIKIFKNGTLYNTYQQIGQNKAEVDFYVFNLPEDEIIGRLNSFIQFNTSNGTAAYLSGNWSPDVNIKYYTKINVYNVIDKGEIIPPTRSGLLSILENNGISDSFMIKNESKIFRYDNGEGYISDVEIVRQSIYSTTNSTSNPLFVSYYRKKQPDGYTGAENTYFPDNSITGIDDSNSNLQITIPMVINENITLNSGDSLEFQLLRTISSGAMLYERIQNGEFSIKGSSVVNSIGITINNPETSNPTIALSTGLSFVYGSTRYVPYSAISATNNSKAWSTFGPISEDFVINKNSFVLFIYTPKGKTGIEKKLIRVKDTTYSEIKGQWYLNTEKIPGDLATEIITNKVDYKVCFLSRFLDETAVILNYTFTDNEFGTATNNAGFIVPRNLNPQIQSNLDAVVSTIKNKTNLVTNI